MEREIRPLVPDLAPSDPSLRPAPNGWQMKQRQFQRGERRRGSEAGGVGEYSEAAMRTIAIMPFLGMLCRCASCGPFL
jgi:hypothetical protein